MTDNKRNFTTFLYIYLGLAKLELPPVDRGLDSVLRVNSPRMTFSLYLVSFPSFGLYGRGLTYQWAIDTGGGSQSAAR